MTTAPRVMMPRRRLVPSEREPDRWVEAHNLLDMAVLKLEERIVTLEATVADLQETLEGLMSAFYYGNGSPEGEVTAAGAVYIRLDGDNDTTIYVHHGDDGESNTGWIALEAFPGGGGP